MGEKKEMQEERDARRKNEKIFVALEKEADGTYKAVSAAKTPAPNRKFIQGRTGYETEMIGWEVSIRGDSGNLGTVRPRWFDGFKKDDRVTFCLDERGNVINQYREDARYKPECRTSRSFSGVIEEIRNTKHKMLNVAYGIESYFVEEGAGRAIEKAQNAKDLKVEVSLRTDGKAIIVGLVMDGKRVR